MTSTRTNEAVWLDKYNRWQIKVQKDGIRRTFTSSKRGRTGKLECHRAADEWLCAGAPVDSSIRVKELYEQMLEQVKVDTSTGNYVNLESFGRIWIAPRVGAKKVKALTLADLQRVLNDAAAAGRSRKTIRDIRGAISLMLKYARRNNLTTIIGSDLEIPRNSVYRGKRILTLEQVKTVLTVDTTNHRGNIASDWYINAYRLMVSVGLRPGELCELQLSKQLEHDAVTVHGSVNRFGEHTTGKTVNAQRVIPLPEYGAEIVRAQRELLQREGIISPYLFPMPDGEQTSSAYLYKRWKVYQQTNGISPAISLYELRHTFASLCQRSGIPEEWLKPVMGHSYKMPTYGTYGHSFGDEAVQVAKLLQENVPAVVGIKNP